MHVAPVATLGRVAAVIKSNTKDDPNHLVLRLATRGDHRFAQDEAGSFHTSEP